MCWPRRSNNAFWQIKELVRFNIAEWVTPSYAWRKISYNEIDMPSLHDVEPSPTSVAPVSMFSSTIVFIILNAPIAIPVEINLVCIVALQPSTWLTRTVIMPIPRSWDGRILRRFDFVYQKSTLGKAQLSSSPWNDRHQSWLVYKTSLPSSPGNDRHRSWVVYKTSLSGRTTNEL